MPQFSAETLSFLRFYPTLLTTLEAIMPLVRFLNEPLRTTRGPLD